MPEEQLNLPQPTPEQIKQMRDEGMNMLRSQLKAFRLTAQELKEHTQTTAIGIMLLTVMSHLNHQGQQLARIEQFLATMPATPPEQSNLIVPGR